jgi:F-type H+-transporting ATPase subunit b
MLQNIPVHTFADSSSSGILGLNVQAFVIQLLTFLVVFLALKKWAFKPILKVLDERRKVIESGITLGEKMQKEKEELEQQVSTELHKARQEADKIIALAHTEAKETVQEAEEAARTRADALVADAKQQITQATQRERAKLEKDIIGLVSEVSEAIIGEKVDAKKDAVLIEKAMKASKTA